MIFFLYIYCLVFKLYLEPKEAYMFTLSIDEYEGFIPYMTLSINEREGFIL